MTSSSHPQTATKLIKSPQDFAGGLLIMVVAAFAVWLGSELPSGTFNGMGPGMMPRSVAILLGGLGGVLVAYSFRQPGPGLDAWSIRGILFVLGAILVFAYTVRPLGMAVATPLAILISSFASAKFRLGETLLFTVIMTAFCIGLFKFALRLSIPLAPWLVGY